MIRTSLLLSTVLVLGLATIAVASDVEGLSQQLSPMTKGELIKGKPLTLNAEVVLVFKAPSKTQPGTVLQRGKQDRYFYTLKDGRERELVGSPKVEAPAGVKVKIVSLTPHSTKVKEFSHQEYVREERTGYRQRTVHYKDHYHIYDGYAIRCEIELTAEAGFKPGEQTVTIALPEIERIARSIGAESLSTPTFRFELLGWESEAARQEAKAKEARQKQQRTYKVIGYIVGGLIGLIVLCKLIGRFNARSEQHRRRREARFRIVLPPDGTASRTEPFTQTIARQESELDQAPPSIRQYTKARDSLGREANVTLSCEGEPVNWTNQEWLRPVEILGHVYHLRSYTAEVEYRMHLTVTAGRRVRRGKYLAESPLGLVLIEVGDNLSE